MQLKRFEAATLPEALRAVREAFGADALVLSTRTVRRGASRFGRLGRPVVEVTAACDREQAAQASPAASAATPVRSAPDSSWRELQLARALVDPLEEELRQLRRSVDSLEAAGPQALQEEVAMLRRLAADMRQGGAPGDLRNAGGLLAAGLAPRHAYALGEEAARHGDGHAGLESLVDALAARLDTQLVPAREDDPPVGLYIGPSGAGKTTTVAKLAAREAEPPALVTTDAHRLGSDAALRRFARNLGSSFSVAVSPQRLAKSLSRLAGQRILVDTAGSSRADGEAIAELRAMRDTLGRRARVHLVLSATTKECDLAADLARYAPLEADALVITKVDDSQELGNVVNLLLDPDTPPLAWIGNGQRVPEDLQVPDPRDLARHVLARQFPESRP